MLGLLPGHAENAGPYGHVRDIVQSVDSSFKERTPALIDMRYIQKGMCLVPAIV